MKRRIFKEKTVELRTRESSIKDKLADSLVNAKDKGKEATSSIIGIGFIIVIIYAIFKLFFSDREEQLVIEKADNTETTEKRSLLQRGVSGLVSTLVTKFLLRYLFNKK